MTNCSSTPTASLTNYGSWSGCAGKLVGTECAATCPAGGDAKLACQANGQWATTATGACNTVTNCTGEPSATLTNYGTWPTCTGTSVNDSCTAICPGGGSVTVGCQANGQWQATATGNCSTACPASPLQTLDDGGSWNCTNRAVGDNCTATCPKGGNPALPEYTCDSGGVWVETVAGQCEPGCTAVPTTTVDSGTWPASCANASYTDRCTAESATNTPCNGSAYVTCEAGGSWNSTVIGTCP